MPKQVGAVVQRREGTFWEAAYFAVPQVTPVLSRRHCRTCCYVQVALELRCLLVSVKAAQLYDFAFGSGLLSSGSLQLPLHT